LIDFLTRFFFLSNLFFPWHILCIFLVLIQGVKNNCFIKHIQPLRLAPLDNCVVFLLLMRAGHNYFCISGISKQMSWSRWSISEGCAGHKGVKVKFPNQIAAGVLGLTLFCTVVPFRNTPFTDTFTNVAQTTEIFTGLPVYWERREMRGLSGQPPYSVRSPIWGWWASIIDRK
jgi:hypothetical protein